VKTYEFPNAHILVLPDRTCREHPKWCSMISVPRSRAWVAAALRELRIYRRNAAANQ